jgi:imidazolonepropionase-like amidohydrolase
MSVTTVFHGASVLDPLGSFVDNVTVEVVDGVVRHVGSERGSSTSASNTSDGNDTVEHVDLAGHWLMPGIVDCHSHVSWNDFHSADRNAATDEERQQGAVSALGATIRAGVTSVRDAGGATAELRDAVARGEITGPQLQISVAMIDNAERGGVEHVRRRVREVLDAGAGWVKLVATGGVMAPEGTELDSNFGRAEFQVAVDEATRVGARVMVHAWGGDAIRDAISAGVSSIEHGMFLSMDDAQLAAAAGVTLVPTLTIYSEVNEMVRQGSLPAYILERTERVAAAHPVAVRRARDAGMRIALGSDFGTSAQHGRNLTEIAALARAGLGTEAALLAATTEGAQLLGEGDRHGRIAPGFVFDAIVLRRDPSDVAVFEQPDTVSAVFQGGRAVTSSSD